MPTDKRTYARALNDIARRYADLDDTTVKRMIAALQDLRRDIAATLATGPTEFEAWRLSELEASIGRLIDSFQARLAADLRGQFRQIYTAGADAVTDPLRAVGYEGVFNQINPAQLNAVMDFSAGLVRNIADDMRGKIDTQIRLGVLGRRNSFDVMKAITSELGTEARAGVWGRRRRPDVVKGVAARAEAIYRTESTRVFNLAKHSQMLAADGQNPAIQMVKRWLSAGGPNARIEHLIAHARYEANPIPVAEAFFVGGESMMYPGDPAGSPRNTVHCRCTSQPFPAGLGDMKLTIDGKVAGEIERRQQTEAEAA